MALSLPAVAGAHPVQHGVPEGHLLGTGASGILELLSVERVTTKDDLVADVAVSPDGKWAFLANWGEADCAGPETGGQTSPDAGAWVVDISNLSDPKTVGFIPSHQDTRPGEGMQVVRITTAAFTGDILVVNNEQCGKNGKGGVSLFDVTNPRNPVRLSEHFGDRGQSDANEIHSAFAWGAGDRAYVVMVDNLEFPDVDPELLESTGVTIPPEGNAHQAEYTLDNKMFIATDEDFAPYGATSFRITSGPFAAEYPSVPVPGSSPITILADDLLNGPVAYGGYGCPASAPIPTPAQVPNYLGMLGPGEEKIVVLQRGPTGDPSATEPACFPGEKAHQAALAGWDAVLFVQRHGGTESPPFCGSGGFVDVIVGVCTTHEALHRLFGSAPSQTYPDGPTIGAVGERMASTAKFDGWGYVHLYGRESMAELDTYAIDEAHDPAFATGYGDLSVHEVATDPLNAKRAYLSYYSGGMRAIEIQCSNPKKESTCELVEVGSYLDPHGNDFWGVETFVRDGKTYVLGSDRDSGLWIFSVKG